MKHKLFYNTFLVAIIVFFSCFTITLDALYSYFSGQHIEELKSQTQLIASAINQYGDDFLDVMILDTSSRVTLIAADGTVLQDSRSDSASMGNHADREEVQEALTHGYGQSSRYSDTLSEKVDNYAIRLNNGQVLRFSDTQYTILTLIKNNLHLIVIVLLLALILSLMLSAKVSRSITAPFDRFDLAHPSESDIYPELQPFVARINAQNRQIDLQMKELKQEHERQDKMRREFTANVSHELKTPLTSISGYAEIIRDGMVEPKDIPTFAGRIHSEALRLIALVEDIIRLSRLEGKEITYPFTEVDLYKVASNTLEHLYSVAEKQHISLQLKGEHCLIRGVEKLLDEIIYNLCDNSIKYNNPGGSIIVSVYSTGNSVVLTVSDTGIGIPAEELDRVFERFYRMDKSHSKAVGGTGLGLSIVKHSAAYHNAEIQCESTVGVGTTITIIFPPLSPQPISA
ncbi:MAG: hypothetical protein IJZ85_12845 [Lachnospiraceae bacterium]|nr:hypothetical protein [Lachnospiraceae bacterium]